MLASPLAPDDVGWSVGNAKDTADWIVRLPRLLAYLIACGGRVSSRSLVMEFEDGVVMDEFGGARRSSELSPAIVTRYYTPILCTVHAL